MMMRMQREAGCRLGRRLGLMVVVMVATLRLAAAEPVLATPRDWGGWGPVVAEAGGATATDDGVELTVPGGEGWTAYRCDVPMARRNWLPYTQLQVTMAQVDGSAPLQVRLGLTGIDTELMRQGTSWQVAAAGRQVLTVDLRHGAAGWQADAAHTAVWNAYWRHYVRQLHLELQAAAGAVVRVSDVRLLATETEALPAAVHVVGRSPREPVAGDLLELHLDIWPLMADPYQPDPSLQVRVSWEGAEPVVLRPYFRRDYELREVDGVPRPVPAGPYHWGLRHYLRLPGAYSVQVLRDGRELLAEPWVIDVAAAAPGVAVPGFLHFQQADGGYFEFENGDPFYAIGLNACWPADATPGMTPAEKLPDGQSVAIYDEWYAAMAAQGINTSQIWMTPFWTALEWNGLYDGYGGIGVYSPRAGWVLDRVMDAARRHRIHLLLTLRNHHQYMEKKADVDEVTDAATAAAGGNPALWWGNPWNAANGGPLATPGEWFSEPAALRGQAAYLRYVLARWGEEPQVMAFNLVSEMDNAIAGGLSKTEQVKGHDLPTDQATLPEATVLCAWYDQQRETAATMGATDRPLFVGNCRIRELLGMQIWNYPSVPIVMNDCYVQRRDTEVGAAQRMHWSYTWLNRFRKPVWITETGFSSTGERLHETIPTLHETYWSSSMMPGPGTAMYWWWNHVFEHDLLSVIRPVAAYWAGEDRRHLSLQHRCLWAHHNAAMMVPGQSGWQTRVSSGSGKALHHVALNGRTRAFGYLFSYEDYTYGRDGSVIFSGAQILQPRLRGPGSLVVEFWDTWKGEVYDRRVLGEDFRGAIIAPDFEHDLAYKIWRSQPGEEVQEISAPSLRPSKPAGTLLRRVYHYDTDAHPEPPADAEAALAWLEPPPELMAEALWKQIDDQYNPFDTSWPVKPSINDYSATLYCQTAGSYSFASDSDEASFLWIDDTLVVAWPGNHDPTQPKNRQHSTWEHHGEIELGAGPHRLRYLVYNSAGAMLARLAWRPPGAEEGAYAIVPHAAFCPW